MPTLHIQLLGDFHIVAGETAVTSLNTARLQAFFCFLLMQAHKPQPRHYIASLLWPNSSEAQARTNLRKYIHQLRRKLPATDQLLEIDSNMIQWRADAPAVVDVHEFERCLTQADSLQKQGRPDEVRLALVQAVAAYQGDLLPACYEEWIALPRERLASRYLQALDQLAQLLEVQGHYDQAVLYGQQLLERDALRESSYQRLMQLYMLVGNRAKAIEAYHQCAAVLRREMDMEPGAATHALYERIKSSQLGQVQRVRRQKQMTIVCADIAGFGALTECFDSHTIFADLNVYMNLLHRLILAGQGQVVKRMGDAVLAMFVAAGEAVQTAMTIQQALAMFNEGQGRNGRPLFPTRIGIATGEVLLVHMEIVGVQEIEIMGKCVNTAVHLQQVTPTSGIALDQLTYLQGKSLVQGHLLTTLLANTSGTEPVYILDVRAAPDSG